MGAPAGNQFWKQRAKSGRDKIFKNPDALWKAASEYFQWCDDHPLETEEIYGKDATRCVMKKLRAYTWEGLELFLGIDSLRDYKTNVKYKEFSQVILRISKIIYTQKFQGAAAGLLNHNIIARDLGLIDKTEVTKHRFVVKRK